jgi:hypothetical protein
MSIQHPLKKFYFRRIEHYSIAVDSPTQKEQKAKKGVISFSLKFGYPVIIQSFKLSKKSQSNNPFCFDSIEGNLLGDLIDYEKFLGTKRTQKKVKKVETENAKEVMYYKTSGVGEIVRMNFGIEAEFYDNFLASLLGKGGVVNL